MKKTRQKFKKLIFLMLILLLMLTSVPLASFAASGGSSSTILDWLNGLFNNVGDSNYYVQAINVSPKDDTTFKGGRRTYYGVGEELEIRVIFNNNSDSKIESVSNSTYLTFRFGDNGTERYLNDSSTIEIESANCIKFTYKIQSGDNGGIQAPRFYTRVKFKGNSTDQTIRDDKDEFNNMVPTSLQADTEVKSTTPFERPNKKKPEDDASLNWYRYTYETNDDTEVAYIKDGSNIREMTTDDIYIYDVEKGESKKYIDYYSDPSSNVRQPNNFFVKYDNDKLTINLGLQARRNGEIVNDYKKCIVYIPNVCDEAGNFGFDYYMAFSGCNSAGDALAYNSVFITRRIARDGDHEIGDIGGKYYLKKGDSIEFVSVHWLGDMNADGVRIQDFLRIGSEIPTGSLYRTRQNRRSCFCLERKIFCGCWR